MVCVGNYYWYNISVLVFSLIMQLKVASWNIDGLYSNIDGMRICKFSDPAVEKFINSYDIICIVESHCNMNDSPVLDGYKLIQHNRKKSKKAKRASGGIIVAVKNCISCGISLECKSNSEILWIKLKSNYFGLKNDIYLAAVYISPLNSSYTSKREDLFDILEKDIAQFSKMGSCIICGDFNSRTNIDSDFVVYDNSKYS